MRIDVNDEAARLRRREMPIQCGGESEAGIRTQADAHEKIGPQPPAARECDDCRNEHASCRCNPGEG